MSYGDDGDWRSWAVLMGLALGFGFFGARNLFAHHSWFAQVAGYLTLSAATILVACCNPASEFIDIIGDNVLSPLLGSAKHGPRNIAATGCAIFLLGALCCWKLSWYAGLELAVFGAFVALVAVTEQSYRYETAKEERQPINAA